MIGGRVTATQYHGIDYAYVAGATNLYRYEWNGKNLILDTSWGPVPYLKPGQTLAGAVVLAADWHLEVQMLQSHFTYGIDKEAILRSRSFK